jgi:hypothetical protein
MFHIASEEGTRVDGTTSLLDGKRFDSPQKIMKEVLDRSAPEF